MLVPELPVGNLLLNPWFHNVEEPTKATFENWTHDEYWSLAVGGNKNPSPDHERGTAAKLSKVSSQGQGLPGIPAFFSQVVKPAASALINLEFMASFVNQRGDFLRAEVMGSNEEENGYVLVWTPLNLTENTTSPWTPIHEKIVLGQGYTFYKLIVSSQFTSMESLGTKITGIYFKVS